MGKSKKKDKANNHSPNDTRSPLQSNKQNFFLVFAFWLISVAAYAWALSSLLNVGYGPVFVILTLVLVVVGLLGSGGANDFGRFNGKNAVITMAFVLSVVMAFVPYLKGKVGVKSVKAGSVVKQDKFSPLRDPGKSPVPQSGNFMASALQQAFTGGMSSSGVVKAPNRQAIKSALEKSKRFVWGLVRGNEAFIEAEATMDFADQAIALAIPSKWAAISDSIKVADLNCDDQKYTDGELTFKLSAGVNKCSVTLTEQPSWEVSAFSFE